MVIKQILKEVNYAFDILIDLMKGFPVGAQIFYVVPLLVDDQIRLD